MPKELPKTVHELIRLAVEDMKLILADSDFSIDMSMWACHIASSNKCSVCMAGAVMLSEGFISLDDVIGDSTKLNEFMHCDTTSNGWPAFFLLDSIRHLNTSIFLAMETFQKEIKRFYTEIGKAGQVDSRKFQLKIKVREFDPDKEDNSAFFEDMETIAAYCEEIGL